MTVEGFVIIWGCELTSESLQALIDSGIVKKFDFDGEDITTWVESRDSKDSLVEFFKVPHDIDEDEVYFGFYEQYDFSHDWEKCLKKSKISKVFKRWESKKARLESLLKPILGDLWSPSLLMFPDDCNCCS